MPNSQTEEQKAVRRERAKFRYQNDPEFRERMRVRHREWMRKRQEERPDEARQKSRDYWAAHRDRQKELGIQSYRRHRDERVDGMAKYRQDNAEEIRDQRHRWYAVHRDQVVAERRAKLTSMSPEGRAAVSEKRRQDRRRNRELILERRRQLESTKREEIRRQKREWAKANPEKVRTSKRLDFERHRGNYYARGAQRRAGVQSLPKQEQNEIAAFYLHAYSAPDVKCHWCGKSIPRGKRKRHVDHVKPLAKGGEHCLSNLVVACSFCNCSKHDKMPHEFVPPK